MSIALLLLSIAASDVSALGSDSYHTREETHRRLTQYWPLCRPALAHAARFSPDPEMRVRAARADMSGSRAMFGKYGRIARGIMDRPAAGARLEWLFHVQPSLVRWDMVDFALDDASGKRMVALWLLVSPCDRDYNGLPWLETKWHTKYAKNDGLRLALGELVQNTWKYSDGTDVWLACDPRIWVKLSTSPPTSLDGVDNVRFWLRGLPDIELHTNKYGKWERETKLVWGSRRNDGLPLPQATPPVELLEPKP